MRLRCLILFAVLLSFARATDKPAAHFVSGVYQKGHNLTEPRPRQSLYIAIKDAGFVCVPGYAAYQAWFTISDRVEKPYFVRVTLENPNDPKNPFVEEEVITNPPPVIPVRHGPAKGLAPWHNYTITIDLFRKKGDATPLDSVSQPVRSYIDMTGPVLKVVSSVVGK